MQSHVKAGTGSSSQPIATGSRGQDISLVNYTKLKLRGKASGRLAGVPFLQLASIHCSPYGALFYHSLRGPNRDVLISVIRGCRCSTVPYHRTWKPNYLRLHPGTSLCYLLLLKKAVGGGHAKILSNPTSVPRPTVIPKLLVCATARTYKDFPRLANLNACRRATLVRRLA
ncbi:hypothetical protein BST61_g591 [Cercospora zeina]